MATLTIKNVPEALYGRLEAQAKRHHRSLDLEVVACLEQAVHGAPLDPDRILARARALPDEAGGVWLTDEALVPLEAAGRPWSSSTPASSCTSTSGVSGRRRPRAS